MGQPAIGRPSKLDEAKAGKAVEELKRDQGSRRQPAVYGGERFGSRGGHACVGTGREGGS